MSDQSSNPLIDDLIGEYSRYRSLGEKALAQMPDDALNLVPSADANSAAMIVFHLSGNLTSRFTDFLTDDGEKPWRTRDAEFEDRMSSRAEVNQQWAAGWDMLFGQLNVLNDDDLSRTVTIRRQPLTVHAALSRSLAHVSYHVGQIVLLARMSRGGQWQSLSIPKGGTAAYNANPTAEVHKNADLADRADKTRIDSTANNRSIRP